MDTTETLSSPFQRDTLLINGECFSYLDTTRKWAKFLAILGYVGLGILIIAAIFMFAAGSSYSFGGMAYVLGLVYIALAVLYFFPVTYIFNFSRKMQIALEANSQGDLVDAFRNLKNHYQFVGIMAIVILSIYGIVLVVGLFGLMMR